MEEEQEQKEKGDFLTERKSNKKPQLRIIKPKTKNQDKIFKAF